MGTLVVYYSNEGNTEAAARKIASELSADLLKLVPEKDIPKEGFFRFFTGGMKASLGLGAKLKKYDLKWSDYNQIILGTPIWASSPCPAVNQFLKENADTSKITSVFTFSGGGDNDKCMQILRRKIPGLRNSVALCDRKNPDLSKDNDQKLKVFIEGCRSV